MIYRGIGFMQEQKMSVIFEPSYTLDVLHFLDHLFTPRALPNEEMVCYFEEYLGDDHEKTLQHIRKRLMKFETIAEVLIPLLTADPEFNDLQLSELLASPKYLIHQYKRTASYQDASKEYKKFLKSEAESILLKVAPLIQRLEKAKFKTYWLHSCLPLVNQKIKEYSKDIHSLNLSKQFGHQDQIIYVLSCIDTDRVDWVHQKLMVSQTCSFQTFMYDWVETYLKSDCPLTKPRGYERKVKRNKELMMIYKKVKEDHASIFDYIETAVKLAMTVYICQEWGILENPQDYLKKYQSGHYQVALLFYQELEKGQYRHLTLQQCAHHLLEHVDIQCYDAHLGLMT